MRGHPHPYGVGSFKRSHPYSFREVLCCQSSWHWLSRCIYIEGTITSNFAQITIVNRIWIALASSVRDWQWSSSQDMDKFPIRSRCKDFCSEHVPQQYRVQCMWCHITIPDTVGRVERWSWFVFRTWDNYLVCYRFWTFSLDWHNLPRKYWRLVCRACLLRDANERRYRDFTMSGKITVVMLIGSIGSCCYLHSRCSHCTQ